MEEDGFGPSKDGSSLNLQPERQEMTQSELFLQRLPFLMAFYKLGSEHVGNDMFCIQTQGTYFMCLTSTTF